MPNKQLTLENLLRHGDKVWLYLADRETAAAFAAQADREGFAYGDGVPVSHRTPDGIMVLYPDRTVHFPGFVGHIAFHSSGGPKPPQVDYREYLAGKP